jgi:RNA polymerase sigma-70 factor, ECF subfamily
MATSQPAQSATTEPATRAGSVAREAAFREWYERSLPRVYGYLFNRCGRNAHMAEELTQETFVEAVGSRRDASDQPVAWLIGIARHRLLDHFRKLERRERGFLRLVAAKPPTQIWPDSGADDQVAAAVAKLPAAQRAAIVLRYMDDLPVADICRLLGRSEGAVESLLSRGRAALRESLSEYRS